VKRLLSCLPPVLWMSAILVFSSSQFAAGNTGGFLEQLLRWFVPSITRVQVWKLNAALRHVAHVTIYGVLAGLWLRAFLRERVLPVTTATWVALAITVAWACVDELYQTTVPTRSGSAMDVALDSAGAVAVLIVAVASRRWNGRAARVWQAR
jgi:VanZ family protein